MSRFGGTGNNLSDELFLHEAKFGMAYLRIHNISTITLVCIEHRNKLV